MASPPERGAGLPRGCTTRSSSQCPAFGGSLPQRKLPPLSQPETPRRPQSTKAPCARAERAPLQWHAAASPRGVAPPASSGTKGAR